MISQAERGNERHRLRWHSIAAKSSGTPMCETPLALAKCNKVCARMHQRGAKEKHTMAASKKGSEASKAMKDPKKSHEEKSKAASDLSKSKSPGSKKK